MNQPALSVQIYAVNDQLTEDLDGALAKLSGMGLRYVEAFGLVDQARRAHRGVHPQRPRASNRPRDLPLRRAAPRRGRDTHAAGEGRIRGPAQSWASTSSSTPFVSLDRWLDEEQSRAPPIGSIAWRSALPTMDCASATTTTPREFAASIGGRSAFEVFAEQLRATSRWGSTCFGQRLRSQDRRLCSRSTR